MRGFLLGAAGLSVLALAAGASTAAYAGASLHYHGVAAAPADGTPVKTPAVLDCPATQAMASTKAELHTLVPIYNRPVPAVDKDEPGDRADIDLPFFHVHTRGDHAEVRMFGVKIHSEGDNADVNVGHGHKHTAVHAGAGGAEVVAEDVGRSNANLVYVLASDRRMSSGYCTV